MISKGFLKASSLVAILWLVALQCFAHEMRPAFAQLVETEEGISATLRQPLVRGFRPDLALDLGGCRLGAEIISQRQEGTLIQSWQEYCDQALSQSTLAIRNLYPGVSEVLVSITHLDGSVQRFVVRPDNPVVNLGEADSPLLPAYLELGIEHLLAGLDHVLFVIALMVLITDRWRLVATITAFTIAHSITLALSTFELLQISQSAVEALIALSLLFMAVEMLSKTSSLTANYPWLISFGFGLIHGLGFAGVLREVGLPDDAALWALLLFNIGLEIGQLMVVAACLFLGFLIRYWRRKITAADVSLSNLLPAYFIGPISVWWLLQRLPILS
ncbi:MAG: hypothetical protein CMQ08_00320 [Gammaproteobacteria bacterium]|nr:hypothetical protein [Gammaproteobacteria bacterium]|tara:strand:- start:16 stop:1008 length:993 start_codon:yes stop_codon:yes gene_type:complete